MLDRFQRIFEKFDLLSLIKVKGSDILEKEFVEKPVRLLLQAADKRR
jgi:hypothetical protein